MRWIRRMLCGLVALCALAQAQANAVLVGRTMEPATVDLAQLRGKVVLLLFWSTDCPVCLDKMPELRRNLAGWRGKDFVVVAVSQDRRMADLEAYKQVLGLMDAVDPQLKIVWRGDPAHRDSFGELPQRLPTSVLIDRKGGIVKQQQGRLAPELWDDIAELVLQ